MDLAQLKESFENGSLSINGREYEICKMTHGQRVKVFAYFTSIANDAMSGNFAFMDSDKFNEIEKVIYGITKFNGDLLKVVNGHFEEYAEDYIEFIVLAMGVISYPFLRGKITNLQSQEVETIQTTSKKPMSRPK